MLYLRYSLQWLKLALIQAAFIGFIGYHIPVIGQKGVVDTTSTKVSSFVALPLVFRTPETSWGFGVGAFYAFRPAHLSMDTRPSQLQIGFAYTLLDQLLLYFPFQFFTRENQFQISGELGYYRFVFDYYGIGNNNPSDFREVFTVKFPRVILQSLHNFNKVHYAGLRYQMDNFVITDTAPGGELENGSIPGSNGGVISGLGLVYQLDTRDNIFDTRTGWFCESALIFNSKILGSSFDYGKLIIEARKFLPISPRQTIGVQSYLELTQGIAPFNDLALMGGTKRMRGYYEGRYRDNHYFMTQVEFRSHLFWRISGVFFGGLGLVSDKLSNIKAQNIRYTFGPGLRFALDKVQRINLRLDYGIAKESTGLYITVTEAF